MRRLQNSCGHGALVMLAVAVFMTQSINAVTLPAFTREPQSAFVKRGEEVNLRCQTDPPTNLTWLFNGRRVMSNADTGVEVNGGRLHLESFDHRRNSRGHRGEYQCVSTSEAGVMVSKIATLKPVSMRHFSQEVGERTISVTEGNVALIPCMPPESNPPADILFEKSGTTIDTASSSRHVVLPSGSLQIADVKPADEGVYRCVAFNPVTTQKRVAPNSVHLDVIAPLVNSAPRYVQPPNNSVTVVAGQNLTLECVVEGAPVPVVTWNKYGGRLPEGRFITVFGNLIITNVRKQDEGTYICQAENGQGHTQAKISEVRVRERPIIQVPPRSQSVEEGARASFRCITGWPPRGRSQWYHNGIDLISDHHVIVSATNLTIVNIQPTHSGIYQCVVTNSIGMVSANALLQVMPQGQVITEVTDTQSEDQPTIETPAANTSAAPGANTTITCMTSDPPAEGSEVTWLHEGSPVHSVRYSEEEARKWEDSGWPRYLLFMNGSLLIINVDRLDQGMYQCVVKHTNGEDSAVTLLNIEGVSSISPSTTQRPRRPDPQDGSEPFMEPPSAPIVSKRTDTSVLLEWTVQNNVGLAIQFFKIQYKEILGRSKRLKWKTHDQDIFPNQRHFVVEDLVTGGTYRFRVVAVYTNNDNKQGPNSAKFTLSATDSGLPGTAPIIVHTVSNSISSLSITWQYKPTGDVEVTGFVVGYKIFDSGSDYEEERLTGDHLREHTITDLEAGTFYSIIIRCFNDVGDGPDSVAVSYQTLVLSTPVATHPTNEISTKNSNDRLFMVLGVVLGVMMLLLVVFMVMCACKQRQQRRMLATLDGRHKFHNTSQTIYLDGQRKKQCNGTNGFLLNGINSNHTTTTPTPTHTHPNGNGFIPNYEAIPNGVPETTPNSSHMMNIKVNPIEDMSNHEPRMDDELRASLQEILDQPPPPPPPQIRPVAHGLGSDQSAGLYASLPRSSAGDNTPYKPPPSYASIQRPRGINRQHNSSFHNSPDASRDYYRQTSDHIPRSHERLPYRSHDPGVGHNSADLGSEEARSEHSQSSSSHNRFRPRMPLPADIVRDHYTNTDISSNDGTVDRTVPYHKHLQHLQQPLMEQDSVVGSAPSSRSASPPVYPYPSHHRFEEPEYYSDEDNGQTYNELAHHRLMLDRAQDYSASEHEDLDG